MIIDYSHLIQEYPSAFQMIDGIRKNNDLIEFGIKKSDGTIGWFPYWRASVKVEKQISTLIKLGAFGKL